MELLHTFRCWTVRGGSVAPISSSYEPLDRASDDPGASAPRWTAQHRSSSAWIRRRSIRVPANHFPVRAASRDVWGRHDAALVAQIGPGDPPGGLPMGSADRLEPEGIDSSTRSRCVSMYRGPPRPTPKHSLIPQLSSESRRPLTCTSSFARRSSRTPRFSSRIRTAASVRLPTQPVVECGLSDPDPHRLRMVPERWPTRLIAPMLVADPRGRSHLGWDVLRRPRTVGAALSATAERA